MTELSIKKLLVANRGEIAIRVFRAASELNIRTVALYTFEDRFSLHRYKADEAYQIGAKDDPLKPYLDIGEIIKIAQENDVDAIHPGYGFLSENENFAQACIDAGIKWIGPKPEVMAALGDKISAKKAAKESGVPIVPASEGEIKTAEEVRKTASEIGYPVMVKAAYGGGGRGMRVVHSDDEIVKAFQEASGEAETAFGNPAVFVEKYIADPKHIEVQLLGDQHGNLVHLFERDCSIQRRFQKVVEIAPATSLKQETREALYRHALAIGNSVGYQNAGTVEFLLDENENIYFIEVNTRIQVEHTITEVITGEDIVRNQILIAAGYPLSDPRIGLGKQEDITYRGVAIQCRITTEDPSQNFKPDYGRLVAYRSASGFGIRLDAGNAYAGATISPFFDSMLVKVTASGSSLTDAADRLHRALREFRIRGVKSNISFLLNILRDPGFRSGNTTVHYIANHPELLTPPNWKDRGTKLIRYLGEVNVNGNPDVKKKVDQVEFKDINIPEPKNSEHKPGTKQLLTELGPEKFADWLKDQKPILYTDTTFRDAHQSLLATRVRTMDMLNIAEQFSKDHGHELFSMEVWGGATFDVSMRFLKESPWDRLKLLRKAIPNTLLQMLLRGSNAVGYKAYPDNLIEAFVEKSAETGIDVFRIFDSMNWLEAMKTSIKAVRDRTNSIAEVCICYSGDVMDKNGKYNIAYYTDMVKAVEDSGAHIIAIKDMAGLLKPLAAEYLIKELKNHTKLPIHLHTHDTSSIQAATYLKAIDAGVDVVDVAISALSGLTSQPNFNSIVAMMEGHERSGNIDLQNLNRYSNYWEEVRKYYYPFETELKAGTAEVYDHEIPGGQYSNLRPQARSMGLEDQFDTIKKNYADVNEMMGGMIKVTPSSKVVGDMAMFMTANGLTVDDLKSKGDKIAFPDSMISMMKGELGQRAEGWPKEFQANVLKNEKGFTDKPNAHLEAIDFEKEYPVFQERFPEKNSFLDFLSFSLYPKVFEDYYTHIEDFGNTEMLPTPCFFYGLKPNNEITVSISRGKNILIEYLNTNEASEDGTRLVIFRINGAIRSVLVKDEKVKSEVSVHLKANGEGQIGSPLQGSLSKVLVKQGQKVEKNDPLFIIEAMKMESTITAPYDGVITKVHLGNRTMVKQDDLVLEMDKESK
ncbi:pyruvate carboxylase [Portibacter marinus]|uniref:pyruvate carboxylase n=1 Tax=Portibacter marinus TaxID=2898660 RepID=UPI001F3BCC8A|nr:pyruvate carboxylase [Portibacter marinus]